MCTKQIGCHLAEDQLYYSLVTVLFLRRLGDVVVSVLATVTKVCGFEPGQGNGYLRAIKIFSTLSFGWEVKPEVPCRKILQYVKNPLKSHGDG
jgi:hypothetical protein